MSYVTAALSFSLNIIFIKTNKDKCVLLLLLLLFSMCIFFGFWSKLCWPEPIQLFNHDDFINVQIYID